MFQKIIAKIIIWYLKNNRLSGEARALCITVLLNNLQALPISSIITYDNLGRILVNRKPLEVEQSVALRESAHALSDSFARRIIREQIRFNAIELGVHQGLDTYMILFAKAALWVMQEEEKLIASLLDS